MVLSIFWCAHLPLYNFLGKVSVNIFCPLEKIELFSYSVPFGCSVVSNSLWPHGLQHARLPCPSPTPRACSNSCPSSQWCHPSISSSFVPFSSCPQSFPALGSFPVGTHDIAYLTLTTLGDKETYPRAHILKVAEPELRDSFSDFPNQGTTPLHAATWNRKFPMDKVLGRLSRENNPAEFS